MRITGSRLPGLFLGALAFLAYRAGAGRAAAPASSDVVHYVAECEVISGNSVNGYVQNLGRRTCVVNGFVSFIFSTEGVVSNESVGLFVDTFIPSGQRVLVAQVQLPFVVWQDAQCRFIVDNAIRKLPR